MTSVKPSLELSIRGARATDLPDIMAVLEAAKGIMRASGNTEQGTGGYPLEEVILHDIERWHRQVVVADGRIAGYFAFIPSPEPTYATIYEKHGFRYCGIIYLASGDERLAYQRMNGA